jgi:predicted amidohydrolase YtcJ
MLIYPEELPRLAIARSNMVTEVSPFNIWVPDPSGSTPWIAMIGRDRFNIIQTPIRSMVDAGAVVSYGSDWDNVPDPNPWMGVEGMVTRQYPGHPEYGQWNQDERIDIETAIEIFTRNGAMAMQKEDETGTIEVGKSADFIVLDRNLLEIPSNEIHKTKVLRTVLQGRTVFED